jgi:hypothetical protein
MYTETIEFVEFEEDLILLGFGLVTDFESHLQKRQYRHVYVVMGQVKEPSPYILT